MTARGVPTLSERVILSKRQLDDVVWRPLTFLPSKETDLICSPLYSCVTNTGDSRLLEYATWNALKGCSYAFCSSWGCANLIPFIWMRFPFDKNLSCSFVGYSKSLDLEACSAHDSLPPRCGIFRIVLRAFSMSKPGLSLVWFDVDILSLERLLATWFLSITVSLSVSFSFRVCRLSSDLWDCAISY